MSIKMACAQAALSDLALPHINIAILILQLIPHQETRKERVKTGRRKRKKTQDRTRNDGATGRGIGNKLKDGVRRPEGSIIHTQFLRYKEKREQKSFHSFHWSIPYLPQGMCFEQRK